MLEEKSEENPYYEPVAENGPQQRRKGGGDVTGDKSDDGAGEYRQADHQTVLEAKATGRRA